jgi:hypothetical protein
MDQVRQRDQNFFSDERTAVHTQMSNMLEKQREKTKKEKSKKQTEERRRKTNTNSANQKLQRLAFRIFF